MRSMLGLMAAALAGLAGIASTWSYAETFVPFYVGLTFVGGVQAWATHPPFAGARRWVASGVAVLWVISALWAGLLLVFMQERVGPPPGPEITFLGLAATTHRVLGLFGGAVLAALGAWLPDRWLASGLGGPGGS